MLKRITKTIETPETVQDNPAKMLKKLQQELAKALSRIDSLEENVRVLAEQLDLEVSDENPEDDEQ